MKEHPDHSPQISRLNRVEGQIVGIKKMIDQRRYCPDIIQQVRATRKALLKVESEMLTAHLEQCVTDAMTSGTPQERMQKIEEMVQIFRSADGQGIEL